MSDLIDVSIAQDGGVMKRIIQAAPDGAEGPPPNGFEVKAHYTGTLENGGIKFDSSVDRGQPFKFVIGKGQVIRGKNLELCTLLHSYLSLKEIFSPVNKHPWLRINRMG
jgi:hypothetical protein